MGLCRGCAVIFRYSAKKGILFMLLNSLFFLLFFFFACFFLQFVVVVFHLTYYIGSVLVSQVFVAGVLADI